MLLVTILHHKTKDNPPPSLRLFKHGRLLFPSSATGGAGGTAWPPVVSKWCNTLSVGQISAVEARLRFAQPVAVRKRRIVVRGTRTVVVRSAAQEAYETAGGCVGDGSGGVPHSAAKRAMTA
jgi:hypothetical protein